MIYLPPPQPVLNKDIRVSGDVEIHPTASIAPGAILQAAPNCRIVIGADACIGMGVIVNACQGSVEIGNGAILGSGVLIIGDCQIGDNACLGTAVTVFQTNVESMKVIEPGSVLGDSSRKIDVAKSQKEERENNSSTFQSNKNSQRDRTASNNINNNFEDDRIPVNNSFQDNSTSSAPTEQTTVQSEARKEKDSAIGQVYINQLLVTLFPHKKNFDSNTKKLE